VGAIVLAGIVLLVFAAGSYMVSSRLNRDAETAGNSASAPNAPGRINEQPMKDRTPPRQAEPPLVETNVPPAGRQKQRSPDWLEFKDPRAPAVRREAEEDRARKRPAIAGVASALAQLRPRVWSMYFPCHREAPGPAGLVRD